MENDKISNVSVEVGTFTDPFQIYLTSLPLQTAKKKDQAETSSQDPKPFPFSQIHSPPYPLHLNPLI